MSEFYKVIIGLGNSRGATNHVIMEESKKKIEKQSAKDGRVENPRIKLRELPQIDMGGLGLILKNKRNKNTLTEMLKLNDIEVASISQKSQIIMKGIIEEEQMLQVFRQDNEEEKENEKFMKETGANAQTAKKYRLEYQQHAVKTYKDHETKIKRFIELNNNCSRENAIAFLESNKYDMGLFE